MGMGGVGQDGVSHYGAIDLIFVKARGRRGCNNFVQGSSKLMERTRAYRRPRLLIGTLFSGLFFFQAVLLGSGRGAGPLRAAEGIGAR